MPKPVYLMASERSGTNLLRKLITEHQNIYFGPSPAHFLDALFYTEPFYDDLSSTDNFKKLVEDALSLCYVHFSPWIVKFNVNEIIETYDKSFNERKVILLSHHLMQLYAESQGYHSYFCKDNSLFEYMYAIKKYFPDAKIIYLYRDPRDVAISQLKIKLQTNCLYMISELWKSEQIKSIRVLNDFNNDVYRVSYENLISNTYDTLRGICNFLEVDFNEKKNDAHIFSGKSVEWKNIDKEVITNNSGKFMNELNNNEIKIIESICHKQMEYIGYSTINNEYYLSKKRKQFSYIFNHLIPKFRRNFEGIDKENKWSIERRNMLIRIKNKLG